MVPRSESLQVLARLRGPRLLGARRAAARVGEFALVHSGLVLLCWQQRWIAAHLVFILVAGWHALLSWRRCRWSPDAAASVSRSCADLRRALRVFLGYFSAGLQPLGLPDELVPGCDSGLHLLRPCAVVSLASSKRFSITSLLALRFFSPFGNLLCHSHSLCLRQSSELLLPFGLVPSLLPPRRVPRFFSICERAILAGLGCPYKALIFLITDKCLSFQTEIR